MTQRSCRRSTMYVRRASSLAALAGACMAASCSDGSSGVAPAESSRAGQALEGPTVSVGAVFTIQLRPVSRTDAVDELSKASAVELLDRGDRCFTIIRTTSGALAEAPSDGDHAGTVVQFLRDYGAIMTWPSGATINEAIQLNLTRNPIPYREGSSEGTIVLFRQMVDGFYKQDTLIGGKFVGRYLAMVSGCLHDPTKSPTRLKQAAVMSASDAKAALLTQVPPESIPNTEPRGYVWFEKGRAEWILGAQRLDAATGEYLGTTQTPAGDPITVMEHAQQQ